MTLTPSTSPQDELSSSPAPSSRTPMFSYALGLSDWSKPPQRIEDPQEIFNISHDYFSECHYNLKVPTFTGLSLKLGLPPSELRLLRKSNTPQGRALTLAISIIVDMVERELITSKAGHPGLIFWLKNIDEWVDKTEVVQTRVTMKDFLAQLKAQSIPAEDTTSNPPTQIDAHVLSEA
jgi:hypothetical protein